MKLLFLKYQTTLKFWRQDFFFFFKYDCLALKLMDLTYNILTNLFSNSS